MAGLQITLLLSATVAALAVAAAAVVWILSHLRGTATDAEAERRQHQDVVLRGLRAEVQSLADRLSQAQERTGETLQRTVAEQLRSVAAALSGQLMVSQQSLGDGLTTTAELIGSVQRRLGEVVEMTARLERVGASVDELRTVLVAPKLRGLMGEKTLEAMLERVLPRQLWSAQHRFADGRVVDAAVFLGDRVLPIDAKFPLEAYRRLQESPDDASRDLARRDLSRSVRSRVDEIAARYLRPAEGTTEIALMFIPAEGVYAEVLAAAGGDGGDLVDYALRRGVVPVSPASLVAYLSVVAAGLRGLEVESRATQIVATLAAAENELERLREESAVLGRHLQHALQKWSDVERRSGLVSDRLRAAATAGGEVQAASEGS